MAKKKQKNKSIENRTKNNCTNTMSKKREEILTLAATSRMTKQFFIHLCVWGYANLLWSLVFGGFGQLMALLPDISNQIGILTQKTLRLIRTLKPGGSCCFHSGPASNNQFLLNPGNHSAVMNEEEAESFKEQGWQNSHSSTKLDRGRGMGLSKVGLEGGRVL